MARRSIGVRTISGGGRCSGGSDSIRIVGGRPRPRPGSDRRGGPTSSRSGVERPSPHVADVIDDVWRMGVGLLVDVDSHRAAVEAQPLIPSRHLAVSRRLPSHGGVGLLTTNEKRHAHHGIRLVRNTSREPTSLVGNPTGSGPLTGRPVVLIVVIRRRVIRRRLRTCCANAN